MTDDISKTNDVASMGADFTQLGAEGLQNAFTDIAKSTDDAAIKGSAISAGKSSRMISKLANGTGNVLGGIDVGVAAFDFGTTMFSDASISQKVSAGTKLAVKATIYAIGFSNPITGALLGVADAFGATDAIADWVGSWF